MKRPPAALSESLSHRLSSYALAASAAGVGMLALIQSAEGKIVYTRTNETCPCEISLNNDGMYDFSIGRTSSARKIPGEFWSNYPVTPLIKGNRVWGSPHRSLLSSTSVQWAFALRSGALIHAVPKRNLRTVLFSWGCNSTGNGCFSTYYVGYWVNRHNRYLGLRFIVSGKAHYGWARLSVVGMQATLTGYAYETIPNKPIITGKTKGPDVITVQGPSLGHLARGASAVQAWRTKGQ